MCGVLGGVYLTSVLQTELVLGNPDRAVSQKREAEWFARGLREIFIQQLALLSDLAPPPFLRFSCLFSPTTRGNPCPPGSLLA